MSAGWRGGGEGRLRGGGGEGRAWPTKKATSLRPGSIVVRTYTESRRILRSRKKAMISEATRVRSLAWSPGGGAPVAEAARGYAHALCPSAAP